ncbi:MAG TPA: Ig-like domain repeat protein [Acidimicrobiales bacterium]|nr:Ig-like domain repeat protein [Acidimicrobiales bacterium]
MAQDLDLQLVEGGGQLSLRGSEEPYQIQNPTSITGTIDAPDPDTGGGTGSITAGTFTTPQVNIVQHITSPVDADVFIDADFAPTTPGNLTGTVDADGNVFVSTSLAVTLNVDVGRNPTILTAECISSPVALTLSSTAPHDPATGLVTLVNDNFSIPAPPGSGACENNVRNAIIAQLAGGGHAISLTLQGALPRPQVTKEPTDTTLAVAPDGGALAGDPITLTATVAPDSTATAIEPRTGFVNFLDGGQTLASVELQPDGTAELVTTALPTGSRTLTARYRGDATWGQSTSPAVAYTVFSDPALTWDLPAFVRIHGGSTDFTVTALNTALGQDLTNVRLDIAIQRTVGTGPIGPTLGDDSTPDRITLAHLDGSDATPITLTSTGSGSNQVLSGSIGASTGTPLTPGASITEALRLAFPAVGTVNPTMCGGSDRLCPGPLGVTFTLQLVNPDTGAIQTTIASEAGATKMIEATRRPTTVGAGGPGIPPLVPATPAVAPQLVRAGNAITLNLLAVDPRLAGVNPEGPIAFALDGAPIGARRFGQPPAEAYRTELPFISGSSYLIPVPAATSPGTHNLTIRYSGDDYFQPSVATFTFSVAANLGAVYECERPGFGTSYVGRANVIAQASLPSVAAAGSAVNAVNPSLRLLFDRGPSAGAGNLLAAAIPAFTGLVADYGVPGTASGTSLTRTTTTRLDTTTGDPDQVVQVNGLAMGMTIDGTPGQVLPIQLRSFQFRVSGIGERLSCTPVSDPITLGQVTVAGTTLTVSPGGPVRAGAAVALEATTGPVSASGGVMELRDGDTTIGVVDVDADGKASLTTTDLPVGGHSLTARYLGGLTVPVTTSEAVPLTVIDTFDCAAFTQAGNAAVVRLVYLELLGRCPDQAGFDHWAGRLDAGASASSFARSISGTDEAVGRVVDDAYITMLGRSPDPAGRVFWTDRLQASGRYDQLLADLAASPEFWAKAGGTNTGFVTRVYDRLLGRTPDTAGLNHWVGRLDTGISPRALVLTLANLDEPLGRLVVDAYDEILGRAPFAAERTAGIAYLRATGSRSGLYAQLIGTTEFHTRAQGHPNPED